MNSPREWLQDMPHDAAAALGEKLRHGRFFPLPEVDIDGRLIGVRMWRLRNGLVEHIVLPRTGAALGVRSFARYDYTQPFQHGDVIETRSGHAANVLRWLLTTGTNWADNQGRQ